MNNINTSKHMLKKEKAYFEELYHNHYAALVRFAEGILYDADEAMDVVQETFVDLWHKAEQLTLENHIKSYLYACVKYKAFNRIKKLKLIDRHEEQLKEAYINAQVYEQQTDDEIKTEVLRIMKEMPEQMRIVVEYHNLYGWKYQEIADELGLSINTVKTQVKRAYKRFRTDFNRELIYLALICYWVDKM